MQSRRSHVEGIFVVGLANTPTRLHPDLYTPLLLPQNEMKVRRVKTLAYKARKQLWSIIPPRPEEVDTYE